MEAAADSSHQVELAVELAFHRAKMRAVVPEASGAAAGWRGMRTG